MRSQWITRQTNKGNTGKTGTEHRENETKTELHMTLGAGSGEARGAGKEQVNIGRDQGGNDSGRSQAGTQRAARKIVHSGVNWVRIWLTTPRGWPTEMKPMVVDPWVQMEPGNTYGPGGRATVSWWSQGAWGLEAEVVELRTEVEPEQRRSQTEVVEIWSTVGSS